MSAERIAAALQSMQSRIDRLEGEILAPLITTVELLNRKVNDASIDEEDPRSSHKPWKCESCRGLLGFYDEKRDVMRIRVKDYHVQVHAGSGGWIEVACRRCGHPNRVSYAPSPGEG